MRNQSVTHNAELIGYISAQPRFRQSAYRPSEDCRSAIRVPFNSKRLSRHT
jgi:hypothetical protein